MPCHNALCADVEFDIDRYLAARGDARIKTWSDWVANAKFRQDESRAGAENWIAWDDHQIVGKADRLARSYVARLALLKVMYENGIDAFVHPEVTVPTPKIQGPNVGSGSLDGITPFFQIPRIAVPAGVNDVIYEPAYALNADKTDYDSVLPPGTAATRLPHPMPISITFFAGQGDEPTLIKIGTAYESATHYRFAPPAFGPVAPPTPKRAIADSKASVNRSQKAEFEKFAAGALAPAATRGSSHERCASAVPPPRPSPTADRWIELNSALPTPCTASSTARSRQLRTSM